MVDRVKRDHALRSFLKEVKEVQAESASSSATPSQGEAAGKGVMNIEAWNEIKTCTEFRGQHAELDREKAPCLVNHERSADLLQKHLKQFQQWSQQQPRRHTQKQLHVERVEKFQEEKHRRETPEEEKKESGVCHNNNSPEEVQAESPQKTELDVNQNSPVEAPLQTSEDRDACINESLTDTIDQLHDRNQTQHLIGDDAWNVLNDKLDGEINSDLTDPLCGAAGDDWGLDLKSAAPLPLKDTDQSNNEVSGLDALRIEDLSLKENSPLAAAKPRYGPRAASARKTKGDSKEKKRVSFGGVEMKEHPSRKDLLQENIRRQRRKTPEKKRICTLGARCKFDSNCPYLHPRRDLRNSLGNSDFYALPPLASDENRRLSWTPGISTSSSTKGIYQFRL
ncbi:hypothetical protein CAPTEDRAFT_222345 [Capitella teleta]|uniref:C3H1-type domain-containing protein n=1 Tax=Capitella teleta TaxID=283909 RepID=R7U751_CAPTE|nr:hypothetical protein CAPTEDRAFT_222345 [Capitella teleta]|eukprot:ELT99501.1 hypothetical protein CAPTEDRAFT_222345 [Capitella teleta]